jgi:hypothetical protein
MPEFRYLNTRGEGSRYRWNATHSIYVVVSNRVAEINHYARTGDWVKSRGKTRVTSATSELNIFTDLMGKSVAERVITFILYESERCGIYASVISLEQASSQVTT